MPPLTWSTQYRWTPALKWNGSAPGNERPKMIRLKLGIDRLAREVQYEKMLLPHTKLTAPTAPPQFATTTPTMANYLLALNPVKTDLDKLADLAGQMKEVQLHLDNVTLPAARAKYFDLGGSVVSLAAGNVSLIPLTGFELVAESTPQPITQVMNLVVTISDQDGALDVGWDSQRAADGFEIQLSLDTPANFQPHSFVGVSSLTLTGLPSLKKIWVRVRAIRGTVKGPWSDPAVGTTL